MRLHARLGVLTVAIVVLYFAASLSAQPFPFLQPGYNQQLYATSPDFDGGIAFSPNGDLWIDHCFSSGSPLLRFSASATTTINGTVVHTQVPGSPFPSNAGCGLTNHPDGTLYSNTYWGVVNLHVDTGAQLRAPFGPPGN